VDPIAITPEVTLQEYNAGLHASRNWENAQTVFRALYAIGSVCLAASAALTWGTPASILAGLALFAFIFNLYFVGRVNASLRNRGFKRYVESNRTYVFTDEHILLERPNVRGAIGWPAVDRALETKTAYLLIVGSSFMCIPKRNIPTGSLDDFMQLLRAHRLQPN